MAMKAMKAMKTMKMTMSTQRVAAVVALALGVAFGSGRMAAQSGYDVFQKALAAERADGNLPEAIKLYEQITRDFANDRPLVARTLLRLGECYQTLGDKQAQAVFDRLVRQFSDQKEAAEARTRLSALAGTRPTGGGLTVRLAATGNDADSDAFITPDGRFLARPDWETGDLAVRDMTTGKATRLMAKAGSWDSSDQMVDYAIPSPDGRQIAYVWFPDNKSDKDDRYQLRVMANEVGAKSRALVDSPEYTYFEPVAWAPDGASLLVTLQRPDRSWQIAWVALADGRVTSLRSLGWRLRRDRPSLSADGKYVAYSALTQDPGPAVGRYGTLPVGKSTDQHLYVLPIDGSRPEAEVVKGANINESPVWTPDGKHVLFVSNRSAAFGLWSVDIESGKAVGDPVPVKTTAAGRISPIGITRAGTYYYIPADGPGAGGGGFDVLIADVEPGTGKIQGPGKRLSDNVVDWNRSPAWSPDGKRIAFKRRLPLDRSAIAAAPGSQFVLVVHNVDAGTERVYASPYIDLRSPAIWFHDGRTLLTRRTGNSGGSGLLQRLDLDTGEFNGIEAISHARLPANWQGAVLSPDDRTLYMTTFVSPNDSRNLPTAGFGAIVSFDLATGQEKEVWTSKGRLTAPPTIALSPDGHTLAMKLRREGWAHSRLIRIGIDGTDYRELLSSMEGSALAWTRDSRSLLVVASSSANSPLVQVSAATGGQSLTGVTIANPGDATAIDFSPDGSRLAYSDRTRDNGELWAVDNIASHFGSVR